MTTLAYWAFIACCVTGLAALVVPVFVLAMFYLHAFANAPERTEDNE